MTPTSRDGDSSRGLEESFTDLLRRAKAGEPAALAELHARYQRSVSGVVRRRLGRAMRRGCDSSDVVQSVFEDVLRELPRFEDRGEPAFRHWLHLKAENKVRDRWRRRVDAEGRPRESGMETPDAERPVAGPGPATEAGDADDRARLRSVLAELPDAQREILSLRDESGLSFAAIAERLGLAGADAARMRYARALLALRKRWTS